MISEEFSFIFVHIPRTAGQSIENFFLDRSKSRGDIRNRSLLRPNFNRRKGPPRLAHLTAEEYLTKSYVESRFFAKYFKFAFIRNPWQRLFSEYCYSYQHKHKNFKLFLFKHFPTKKNDSYFKLQANFRHVLPQYQYIFNDQGKQLVDFIGRFENLESDFKVICKKLNIVYQPLPKTNRSNPDTLDYRRFYDAETRDFVANFYAEDISRFNYSF